MSYWKYVIEEHAFSDYNILFFIGLLSMIPLTRFLFSLPEYIQLYVVLPIFFHS